MFIKNLRSGVIQECNNNDVIKHCKADKNYQVAETAESLIDGAKEEIADNTPEAPQEEPEQAPNEEDEEISNDGAEIDSEASENAQELDYASMKVEELRKVAKTMGIQGYGNMNKDTLVEVIKAHE